MALRLAVGLRRRSGPRLCARMGPSACHRHRPFGSTAEPTSEPTSESRMMDGMLVLELANVLAGPSVGQFLGELGATVIKLESTATKGDVTRTWRLPNEDPNDSVTAYFSAANLGKQSLSVDLRHPSGLGLDVVRRLADKADVVLASFKPGDAEKMGVDADSLCARNPRLIYGQVTGYGLHTARAGYDAVVQAESGFQFMNGAPDPDGEPCKMPVALVDVIAAHQLKQAILLRLWRRERSGLGGHVHVSLMASAVSALANQATGFLRAGVVPLRMGSDHPTITPYGSLFATKLDDELVTLGVGTDSQFRSLCEVLALDGVAADARFATNPSRCKHRAELKQILATAFEAWKRSDLLAALQSKAVPCGGVNDMETALALPQASEMIARNDGEPVGLRQIAFKEGLGAPLHLCPPPQYAQHSTQVLADVLGMSAEEIKRLKDQGAIE